MRRNAKYWATALTTTALTAILSCGSAYAAAATYTVKPGDTLWLVARQFNLPVTAVQQANPGVNANDLLIGQVLALPAQTGTTSATSSVATSRQTYTIRPGDTEWSIAKQRGVSLYALQQLNPQLNPQNLLPGQVVALPAGAATATTSASAAPSGNPAPAGASQTASPPPAQTATQNANLMWMERVIAAEAQGQPTDAKLAVGAVVMNRLHAGYGQSVQGVVFQKINGIAQFTSVANGWIYKVQPSASDVAVAEQVLSGTDILPTAMVFYNPAQTPAGSWVRQQPVLASYGNLTFAS